VTAAAREPDDGAPLVEEDFAGPGGFDEGARLIGLDGIIGYEHDKAACATARAAGHVRELADVAARVRHPGAWGYIASPPCQAWSTAGSGLGQQDKPAIMAHVAACEAEGRWFDYPRDGWADERSPLVLEPLRAAYQTRPTWIALEQVPAVLELWRRFAHTLRGLGYRVWCGVLDAEMYGVPQTRGRAILLASLDAAHNVSRPPATHARFVKGETPVPDLFGDLLPWVSMADALGWGNGALAWHRNRSAAFLAENPRRDHPMDEPAPVIDSKARSAEWVYVEPSPTITGVAPSWIMNAAGMTGLAPRNFDEPSATITGKGTAALTDGVETVRVSIEEAATLQSFRPDYPWHGSKSKQHEQVGNAIPPLLAAAILGHLLGLEWQHVCRNTAAPAGGQVAAS
jgi:DNA (cytosine-5)-methyltransferase 1